MALVASRDREGEKESQPREEEENIHGGASRG